MPLDSHKRPADNLYLICTTRLRKRRFQMDLNVRIDTPTLAVFLGAAAGLLLLRDICAHRHAVPAPTCAATRLVVQDRVVTKEFVLTDDSGQTRARIGMNELDAPALSLHDKSGQNRALLRLNQDDIPSLRLFDENETLRSGVGFAQGTMEPHLWFFDQDGTINETLPSMGTPNLNYFRASRNYTTKSYQNVILWNAHTGSGTIRVHVSANGSDLPNGK